MYFEFTSMKSIALKISLIPTSGYLEKCSNTVVYLYLKNDYKHG